MCFTARKTHAESRTRTMLKRAHWLRDRRKKQKKLRSEETAITAVVILFTRCIPPVSGLTRKMHTHIASIHPPRLLSQEYDTLLENEHYKYLNRKKIKERFIP